MRRSLHGVALFLVAGILAMAVTAHAQGITDMKKGEGGSAVQGSAGPSGAPGAASDLERCDKPMGAVAVVEPQDYVGRALARYQLGSPVGLIRLMVQQSNCFIVVERGLGGLGALFGRSGAIVGAVGGSVAGGLKFKEAQTSMLLADGRSGVQVAAAEGSASKADFRLGGLLGGVGSGVAAGVGLGGYSNTNEGKVIAASLADNYNGIVRAVRANPSLQRNVGTLSQEAAAGGQKKAGSVFNEGDVLRPKIGNVRIMSKPTDAGQVVTTLGKGEEMIFLGKEEEGFLQVESGKGSGWVKKILVAR